MSALKLERPAGIGIFVTLAIQTAGALVWAGAAEARLKSLENTAYTQPPVIERLARLEAQMIMAQGTLSRIEARLETRTPPYKRTEDQ
ncbi:MAG TPA: hypothetical protein ENJ42_06015 [Hellea balneolensis]|uniref:Uncharacterized protein n=1 Tax=Hellea balneolensis TaxID=287478 RepID=A0A7C5LZT2_9PROT|nr:hypothetical protein [Hellea balneolensis]